MHRVARAVCVALQSLTPLCLLSPCNLNRRSPDRISRCAAARPAFRSPPFRRVALQRRTALHSLDSASFSAARAAHASSCQSSLLRGSAAAARMNGFGFFLFILLICSLVCLWILAIQAAEVAAESAAAAPRPAFVLVPLPPLAQQQILQSSLPQQEQLAQRFPSVPQALQQHEQQPQQPPAPRPSAGSSSGAPSVHDPRCCEVCTASHQHNPFLPPVSPPPRSHAQHHRRSNSPSPPIPSPGALGPPSAGSPTPLHPVVASIPLVVPAQQVAAASRFASSSAQPHLPRNDTEPVEIKSDEPRLRRPPALCLDRRPDPSNFAQRNDLQGIQQ